MSYIVNPTAGKRELVDEHMAAQLVSRGEWEYEEGSTIQVLSREEGSEVPSVYDLDADRANEWVRRGGEVLTKEKAERYGYEFSADYKDKYQNYGTTAAALGVLDNLSWYQGKNLVDKLGIPASEIIRDNPWEHGLADAGTGLTILAALGLLTGGTKGTAAPVTGPAMAAQAAKLGVRGQKLLGLLKKGAHYTPGPVGQKVFTSLAKSPAASGLGIAGAAAGGIVSGGAGAAPGFLLGTAAGKKFFRETMHQLPAKVLGPTGAPGGAIIDKLGPLYGTGNLVNNILRGHSGRISGLGGEAMVYGLGYGISEADWDKPLPEIAEYISEVAGMSAGIGLGLSGALSGAIGGAKLTAKGVFAVPKKIHDVYTKRAAGAIDDIAEKAEADFTGKSAEALGETSLIKRLDADGVEARKDLKELISDLPELEREANEVIQDVLDVDSTIRSWDQVGFDGAWLMKEVERYVTSGNVGEQVNPALASLEAYRLIQVLKEKINEITGKIQHTMVIAAQTGKPIESSRVVGLEDILGEIDPKHEKVAREIGPGDRGENWVIDEWRKVLDNIESEIKVDLEKIATMNMEGLREAAIDGLHVTPEVAKAHKQSLREYAKDRIAHLGGVYDQTYFDESGKLKKPHPEGKEYLELLDNRVLPENVRVIFRPIAKKEGTVAMTHVEEKGGVFHHIIQLDYKKILESWKRKDWENPSLKGVLPLHELANNTPEALRLRFNEPDSWFHFILEHEIQHIVTPDEAFHGAISGEKALFEKTFWGHLKRLREKFDEIEPDDPFDAAEMDATYQEFSSSVARAFRKAEEAVRKGRTPKKDVKVGEDLLAITRTYDEYDSPIKKIDELSSLLWLKSTKFEEVEAANLVLNERRQDFVDITAETFDFLSRKEQVDRTKYLWKDLYGISEKDIRLRWPDIQKRVKEDHAERLYRDLERADKEFASHQVSLEPPEDGKEFGEWLKEKVPPIVIDTLRDLQKIRNSLIKQRDELPKRDFATEEAHHPGYRDEQSIIDNGLDGRIWKIRGYFEGKRDPLGRNQNITTRFIRESNLHHIFDDPEYMSETHVSAEIADFDEVYWLANPKEFPADGYEHTREDLWTNDLFRIAPYDLEKYITPIWKVKKKDGSTQYVPAKTEKELLEKWRAAYGKVHATGEEAPKIDSYRKANTAEIIEIEEGKWFAPEDEIGEGYWGDDRLSKGILQLDRVWDELVEKGARERGLLQDEAEGKVLGPDSSIVDLMRIISDKSISHKEQRRVLKIAMSELEDSEITGRKMKLTQNRADYENYINRRALEVSPEIAPRYKHRVSAPEGFVDDAINQHKNDPLAALEIIEDYAPELFDNKIGHRLAVLLFKQFEELASDIHVRARNGEFTEQTIDTGILTRMKDLIRKHLSDDDYLRSIKDNEGFDIEPNRENRKPYGGLARHKTALDNLFFEREKSADAVKDAFGVISQSDHRTWEADPNMVKKWMESLRGTTYNKQIPVLLNYLRSTKELFDKLVHDGHYGGASGTPHAREVMRRRFGKTYTDKQWAGLLGKQADKINGMHKEAHKLNEKFTSPQMKHALAWIAATAREGSSSELSRLRASAGASPINMALGGAALGGYLGGIPGAVVGGVVGGAARPAVDLFSSRIGSEKLYLRQIGMIEAMFKAGEETVNNSVDSFARGLRDKGPAEGRGALKYPRALISREIALQVEGSSHLTLGIVGPQREWKEEKKKEKFASGNKFGAEEFDNARRIFSGLMENPEMLDKVVKFSVGELEGAAPQLASFLDSHWKNAIMEMAKIINKASPPVDKTKIFAKKVSPPDSVLHDIGEKLKIFDHSSAAIFKKMRDGTLTQSDVDFFKRINPSLWGAMTEKFMVILQDEKLRSKLNEEEERMIKLLIGEEENTALHSALQRHYLPAGEGEGGGMAGQPERKGSAKKMDLPTGCLLSTSDAADD